MRKIVKIGFVCLLCAVYLSPLAAYASDQTQAHSPMENILLADETPAPEPTRTPRPTHSVFPVEDGESADLGGQDEINLPTPTAETAPVESIRPSPIRVIDVFGYGLILIGVGLIWMFLAQRKGN